MHHLLSKLFISVTFYIFVPQPGEKKGILRTHPFISFKCFLSTLSLPGCITGAQIMFTVFMRIASTKSALLPTKFLGLFGFLVQIFAFSSEKLKAGLLILNL